VKLLGGLFAAARSRAVDGQAPRGERLQAIRLLGRGLDHQREDLASLTDLLVPQMGDDVQAAAVATLGRLRDAKVPELLVRNWRGYGPGVRAQVLDLLLRRGEWANALLDAIERQQVLASEIGAAQRQRLLDQRDGSLRARAVRVFAGAVDPDREKVIRAYQAVLTTKGDPAHGSALFAKTCATCHRLGGVGHEVGPDLASVGDKSPAGLLIAILDPNRSVEARYVNYQAVTKNGVTLTGILGSETGSSITLIGPDAKQQVVLRTDLEQLTSSGKSAMPEGIEKDLKPQDVADLIAHVRSATPQPERKTFAGNEPTSVRPDADRSLRLRASEAAIFGSTLVFQPQNGNLGYWSSADDRAVWTVDVAKAGTYEVWFDWSCAGDFAGNPWVIEAGLERLTGKVASTGSWDVYRQAKIGTLTLQAGPQEVVMRSSAAKVRGSLLDLKAIRLVPPSE
jgi:putative heme-binding domain-containing protein